MGTPKIIEEEDEAPSELEREVADDEVHEFLETVSGTARNEFDTTLPIQGQQQLTMQEQSVQRERRANQEEFSSEYVPVREAYTANAYDTRLEGERNVGEGLRVSSLQPTHTVVQHHGVAHNTALARESIEKVVQREIRNEPERRNTREEIEERRRYEV